MRINKFLAQNNIASRRKADELIVQGEVFINGHPATVGSTVDPQKDEIIISGKRIQNTSEEALFYVLMNKPKNVLSSVSDDRGRETVIDLLNKSSISNDLPKGIRLYPVGRLDYNSTGLILLTNDGELTYKLTHPKYHIPKKYIVIVNKEITDSDLNTLANGDLELYGKKLSKADVHRVSTQAFNITLYEGLKRQIREMCKLLGYRVVTLHRTNIGKLSIASLREGSCRLVDPQEQAYLLDLKELN